MTQLTSLKATGLAYVEPYRDWLEARIAFWTGRIVLVKSFAKLKGVIDEINEMNKADDNDIDYDTKRSGVYILLGEENGKQVAYIGKADETDDGGNGNDIGKRLTNQYAKHKEWCKKAILVIDTGRDLSSAYVQYLESHLVQIAKDINNVSLEKNKQIPKPPKLSNTRSKMVKDDFLKKLFVALDSLNVDIFTGWEKYTSKQENEKVSVNEKSSSSVGQTIFELKRDGHYDAKLIIGGERFIVLEGSYARGDWEGKDYGGDAETIESLKEGGILVLTDDKKWRFTGNFAFKYISTAAKVVAGRNVNGHDVWKVEGSNKTFKEWKTEQPD